MTTNINGTEFKYSPVWKRLVALAFDLTLVGLLTIAIHFISPTPIAATLSKWVLFIVFMTYSIFFDYYQLGTPGKHLMKIKILYTYDQRSYLLTTFYRNILKGLFAILIFDIFWVLIVPYRQGLHNLIAKCIIVDDNPDATTANKVYKT
jgi:uncharacterized RDD family membrane protein YckC